MKSIRVLLSAMGIGLFGAAIVISAASARPNSNGAAAFEKMKSLAGHWEGNTSEDAKLTADIEVASDGHSVLEKFQMVHGDKPMNMITVYFLDGDILKMTHYCGTGNQPTMAGNYDAAANTIKFDLVSATNMKPDDLHMHHAYFTLVDANHLKEVWTLYKDQKSAGMETMFLTRGK